MARHAEKFVGGAVGRGVPEEKASEIFNLMAQFADYGFNRSHSVAYAFLAFQTAYLKAHYPAYFYASVLSHESQDSAKVFKYSKELRAARLGLLPPDINESDEGFTPLDGAVRFGLGAIKGIGTASVQAILAARAERPFRSLTDFLERIESGTVNRKGMESLVAAGSFDSLRPDGVPVTAWRPRLFSGIDRMLSHVQKTAGERLSGQSALFGGIDGGFEADWRELLPETAEWTPAELSKYEKAAVGFYLSAHPLDDFAATLEGLAAASVADLGAEPGMRAVFAGIVSAVQVKQSRKGNRFCTFRVDDRSGGAKCVVWSEGYSRFSHLIRDDELVIVEGRTEAGDGGDLSVIVEGVRRLADALPLSARRLTIGIPAHLCGRGFLDDLLALLGRETGRCEVRLEIDLGSGVRAAVESGPLRIQGSADLAAELAARGCRVEWLV
jgi:DNA polymerase-3 subunit alpha